MRSTSTQLCDHSQPIVHSLRWQRHAGAMVIVIAGRVVIILAIALTEIIKFNSIQYDLVFTTVYK